MWWVDEWQKCPVAVNHCLSAKVSKAETRNLPVNSDSPSEFNQLLRYYRNELR